MLCLEDALLRLSRKCPAWAAAALLFYASTLAAGDDVSPALEAEPSPDGLVTWWLHSPVIPLPEGGFDAATPPLEAREGKAVPGGAGAWGAHVSDNRFVDFKPFVKSRGGVLWASCRVHTATAGKRRIRGFSYCGLRVFVNGQAVLNKPQPLGGNADDASAEIDLPKGASEISVGILVRSGHAALQLALTETALQKPVAGDRIFVPVVEGKAADIAAATVASASLLSKEAFVVPGKPTLIGLAMRGSVPRGVGPLSAKFCGGAEVPLKAAGQLGVLSAQATCQVPADVGAVFDATIEFIADGKVLGKRHMPMVCLPGLKKAADDLEKDARARAARAKKNFPLTILALDKLRLFSHKLEQGEEVPSAEMAKQLMQLLEDAKGYAAQEEEGKDPFETKTGYFERAYWSNIDESAQPYFMMVPTSVNVRRDKEKKFPLVVFLHGYVPSYDKHKWWEAFDDFNGIFEKNDALLALPFGRSNTDFQSCGEVDVLDVIADVKRRYNVDEDRVYIYGYSMGGMAIYTIAAHNPDVFAGAVVIAGRADSPLQNFRPLDTFHPFKQWLIHADNPISLAENFLNIPVRIYHGREDPIIKLSEARRMETRFKELGVDAKLTVIPGDHFGGFDLMMTDEPVKWLLEQKRKVQPEKRRMKAFSLTHAKQGLVEVTAAKTTLEPLELEWSETGGAVAITKDSAAIIQRKVKGEAQPATIEGRHKTPLLCGPVRQAICSPFTIVYGTTGTPEAQARNKKHAEQLATEWYGFTKSRAQLKADKDVTDDEKKTRNLFLVGEEQENLLHAAAAKDLPFSVKDGKATLAGRTIPLTRRGIMYIYPSPFAEPSASRSVVIVAGHPYGKEVGVNHKLDLVPDFLLYSDRTETDSTSTNQPLCAGFFDAQWKVSEKSMWWFPAADVKP